MAPAAGGIGHGITFSIGDGASPEVFTPVAELLDGEGPTMAKDAVETTSGESTNRWRDYIPGLRDGGEVSFEYNLKNANLTALFTNFKVDTVTNYRIVVPSPASATWNFAGVMTNLDPTYPQEDRMTGSFTIKVSGEPTLT